MKKFFAIISVACISLAVFFAGCLFGGRDGVDGKDGSDAKIYDIYLAANEQREAEGLEKLTFLEFIEQYLSYSGEEIEQATSLQAAVNRSLLSGVSVLTNFTYAAGVREYNELYSGSGVIIDVDREAGDAYVVTNCHVVYSSSSEEVYCKDIHLFLYGQDVINVNYTVSSQSQYGGYSKYVINDGECGMKAEIVAASLTYDLALLKVTDSDVIRNNEVYAAYFSDSDVVNVGETVYAVGNSGGNGLSATTGIVSKDSEYINLALDDSENVVRSYRVLRTDAAVNGGNSGGALYNTSGEIVGIVNAKDENDGIDNESFALPVSTVRRVVASMLENESSSPVYGVYRALMGVTLETVSPRVSLDENGNAVIRETAMVGQITIGSAAYGVLQEKDLITHAKVVGSDGTVREDADITRLYILTDFMLSVRRGDTVTLTLKRDGETIEKSITFSDLTHYD